MPRFVLLEHRWDGTHWDLMLEHEGRLRTWALDEPIAPGLALAARVLADHRMAYLDYEGPVSGGRGEVRRVDRGTYEPLAWADDRVSVRLDGDHLRGVATLTRPRSMRDDAPRAGWMLRFDPDAEGNA